MQQVSKPQIDRIWEVIDKAGVCMLVTHSDHGLRARPMEPKPERDENSIWFLTDIRGLKDDEIRADRDVCLTCILAEEKVYLSLTAEASVVRDNGRARALWDSKQNAWWSGPEDPNLILLRARLKQAEMWDGPASSAVAAFEFAKSRLLGTKPNLGEEGKDHRKPEVTLLDALSVLVFSSHPVLSALKVIRPRLAGNADSRLSLKGNGTAMRH